MRQRYTDCLQMGFESLTKISKCNSRIYYERKHKLQDWCWEKTSCVVTPTNHEAVNFFQTHNSVLLGISSLRIRIPAFRNNVAPSSSRVEMSFFSVTSASKDENNTLHRKSYYPAMQWIPQQHCCDSRRASYCLSQPVHGTATYRLWWYQMLYNTISTSWWWAHSARNM